MIYISGLSIHTFHGNFFVRSTDLLSLPNINPDAGFGMQMSIEDSLTENSVVCFQAALLYTSSKGMISFEVYDIFYACKVLTPLKIGIYCYKRRKLISDEKHASEYFNNQSKIETRTVYVLNI